VLIKRFFRTLKDQIALTATLLSDTCSITVNTEVRGPRPGPQANREPTTLPDILVHRERGSGDAVFVRTPSGRARTYGQVSAAVRALAAELAALGAGHQGQVGLYFPNCPAWIVSSFASWALRCTAVTCGTLITPGEAEAQLRSAGVAVVVTTTQAGFTGFRTVRVDRDGNIRPAPTSGSSGPDDLAAARPGDVATVNFSSGTTGAPKGILHHHGSFINTARAQATAFASKPDFRLTTAPPATPPHLIFSPFGHASGYGQLALRMWLGRPVLLVEKFEVQLAAELIGQYAPKAIQLSPAMIHMLATAATPIDLASLEYVASTTAALPAATQALFESRYGVPILQAYGMSETGGISQETVADLRRPGPRRIGSSGRAARGVEIRIAVDGKAVPPGVDGEIQVKTPSLAKRFLDGARPELLDGWFRTGDIGHLDEEGYLFVTGRDSDKLVVGGLNVYPVEVEEAIRSSAAVRDAVVVGLPDPRLGEVPVAGIVWAAQPDIASLDTLLHERIGAYKIPRKWFEMTEVPLTQRGKIDRRKARELAESFFAQAQGLAAVQPSRDTPA
jgi:long-chain acyl-CoA synthetase